MKSGDQRLAIFESSLRENFYPLTLTKPATDLFFGTRSLLGAVERRLSTKASDLYVPKYLESLTKEIHPSVDVNSPISTSCIIVNSLVSHKEEFWNFVKSKLSEAREFLFTDQTGIPVFGRLQECSSSSVEKIPKNISKPLPEDIDKFSLIRYPWELIRDNSEKIVSDSSSSFFQPKSSDVEVRGNKVSVAESAIIERFVTLDSRKGPVIIDEGAELQSYSHLTGPCYVGRNSKVKSAKLREGTSIASNCKVAGEAESSIVSEYSNKSHEGFLGHSIVGSWVNLGAMTSTSDLKNTYGSIRVKMGRKMIDTGEIKLGPFLGDMTKTAIGTLLSSGRRVGVGSQVFGLVSEDVPSFTMYGKSYGAKSVEIYLDSVLTTQKKMMERRGLIMTEARASMIRSVYKMTKGERAFQRVAKTRFKLP